MAKVSKPLIIWSAAWLITVYSAFLMGRVLTTQEESVSLSGDRLLAGEKSAVAAGDSGKGSRRAEDSLFFGDDFEKINPGNVVSELSSVMNESDPVKRLVRLARLLENLDSSNVWQVAALINDQPQGMNKMREMNLLMYAWIRTSSG